MLKAHKSHFLKGYKAYLPNFLKDFSLRLSLPKYDEYIRNINGIDIKLEFFAFPDLPRYSLKTQRIIENILYHRGFMVINLLEGLEQNPHINSFLTYYLLKGLLKKFGRSLKSEIIGIDNLERSKRSGFLYEISEYVDVIYSPCVGKSARKISDELLREFGTCLIRVDCIDTIMKSCSVFFSYDQSDMIAKKSNSIVCLPERGIIYDNLYTKKIITLSNISIDFIPLRDISILQTPVFCNIPVELIGFLCEKLLLMPIDCFYKAKNIFTKDYFDVKIHSM